MSDELLNGSVSVNVPDADGVIHEMTLTIGEPVETTPEPEPQVGGEVESADVANELIDVVEAALADATPDTTTTPPEPRSANMMSAKELAEYDSETVRLVSAQESAVCQLESDLASFKEEAKAAKKAVESAKEALRELIQNRDRQRGRKPAPTLFDAPAQPATTNRVDEDNATDRVNESEPVDPLAELWREYPLTVDNWKPFGLTAKDIERLNSGETKNSGTHPIRVFGDVMRFITPNESSPGFARTLKDFKGFGDAAYDRWLKSEEQFWKWWNNGGKEEFAAERANATL